MSHGYDAAELIEAIKAKDVEIAALLENLLNFSEEEMQVIRAVLHAQLDDEGGEGTYTFTHDQKRAADSVIRKLDVKLTRFAGERRAKAEFAASLTDDELQVIKRMRADKKRGG